MQLLHSISVLITTAISAVATSPSTSIYGAFIDYHRIHPRLVKEYPQHNLSRRIAALSSSSSSTSASKELFRKWFQGEFDNIAQVTQERAEGLTPGEAGGHEQIHCRLEHLPQIPTGSLDGGQYFLGATYYFDNRPEAVFRCRVYSFHDPPPSTSEEKGESILTEMRLHRFTPTFEATMRKQGYDLSLITGENVAEVVEHLDGCSILWSTERGGEAFHGIMRHGYCIVQSQRDVDVKLRIEDDLLLQADSLAVNDRGLDCQTGKLVYGNFRGMPYKLERRK